MNRLRLDNKPAAKKGGPVRLSRRAGPLFCSGRGRLAEKACKKVVLDENTHCCHGRRGVKTGYDRHT
ncbi:hypothetical protein GCM10007924_22460 [Sneathiella chinensis]|uniref:Uncharacterized protein n=1 Tax=Sneathiella chinensis TaxID=349750 RepID=A0ABQ5U5Q7_9PROT|nr:hypothetical protein GCM10007924_22460 [Sneathiella chinensis]